MVKLKGQSRWDRLGPARPEPGVRFSHPSACRHQEEDPVAFETLCDFFRPTRVSHTAKGSEILFVIAPVVMRRVSQVDTSFSLLNCLPCMDQP